MSRRQVKKAASILCCLVILSNGSGSLFAQVVGSQSAGATSRGFTPVPVQFQAVLPSAAPIPLAASLVKPIAPTPVPGVVSPVLNSAASPSALTGAKAFVNALGHAEASLQGPDKTADVSRAAFDAASVPEGDAAVLPDAAAGLPAVRSRAYLSPERRDRILRGGGIQFDSQGRIKPVESPIDMRIYDHDDNIAYLHTKVYVLHKKTREERSIPTDQFADVRDLIGKSGEYADYEFFQDQEGGSYRDFRSLKDRDIFAKDMAEAIDGSRAGNFRGPAWLSFALALADPAKAPWVGNMTARGHLSSDMVRGYDEPVKRKLLPHSPREEMLFGVNTTDPEAKVAVTFGLLDLLESIPLVHDGQRHSYSFSDNDKNLADLVKQRLIQEQAVGRRWPHVKITLLSTGLGSESKTTLVAGQYTSIPPAAATTPLAQVPAPLTALMPEPVPQAGTVYPGDEAVKARKITDTIFVVYDLETSGLTPEVDAPIQVGAAKFRVKTDGSLEILGTYEELVDPKVPLSAVVTLVTGITDADLKGKPSIESVLARLRAFAGEDAVLLAHNAGFDTGFLGFQMKEHSIAPMPHMGLDTKELVKNFFPDILDRRLDELISLWNLGGIEEHQGLSDSLYTAQVFARVLLKASELKNGRVGALTVGDVAEKSPVLHFDTILENLAGRPVKNPRPVPADPGHEVQAKALELFWQRKPSQLRDVAVALQMDYVQLRDTLRARAKTAAVSPADGILEEIKANPPDALILSFDALVDRNPRQDAYPAVSDAALDALIRLLKSGRFVGLTATYGLEDDSALRARIPEELRPRLFFSREGARPLYDAMRASGVKVDAKNWLILGTHLSVAEAFPEASVLSVGTPSKNHVADNARHFGMTGSRASLRVINAVALTAARQATHAAPAAPVDAKAAPEGRRVSFLFSWKEEVKAHPRKTIEKAVSQPKSLWQGTNWFDLVNALSNEELARNVHIVAPKGAAVAEELAALQSLGLIKHLPPTENVKAESSGKASGVAEGLLDELQSAPQRQNSNKIYNQNGTAKKLLHLFSLEDGDWKRYEATRKRLAANIKADPNRWSQVKIIMRYTGDDSSEKEIPDAVLTGDGQIRPLLIAEFAEPFSSRLSEARSPEARDQALPIAISVHSNLPSVTAAINRMFVSYDYGNADPLVVDGDDLLKRERQAIADFVADKKIPDPRKHVILSRYHLEDKELAHVLVDAIKRKTGIRVSVIMDFNSTMEHAFANDEEELLLDFSKAKTKADALGQFHQILLDGGFEMARAGFKTKSRGVLYSLPIFNRKSSKYSKMNPLMHEKSVLLVVEPAAGSHDEPEVRSYYFGTGNLSDHKRYNRLFLLQEPLTARRALEHARQMMEGFREGKISIQPERPYRVYFEDGSFMEIAHTNGNARFNLNGRIIDLFERAANGELQIENVILSHFAPTKSNLFPALNTAMEAQKNIRAFSISEQKFSTPDSYGKVAVMGGFLVTPPLGGPGWGWSGDLTKRVRALEFLRAVEGSLETDPDGAPTNRDVWHDKTTMIHVNEAGRRWVYVFTGSFNASNKSDNPEMQMMFRFPVTSPWSAAIEDSILKTVERYKRYVEPIQTGLVRDVIAAVAALSPLYVPMEAAAALIEAARTRNFSDVKARFQSIIDAARVLGEAFDPRRAAMRFELLMKIMSWFHSEREQGRMNYPLTVQKLVAMGIVVGRMNRGLSMASIKSQLNKALWDPTADKDEMERRVAGAWDVLGIESSMPERSSIRARTRKDPRKIKEPPAPFSPPVPDGNRLPFKNKKAFRDAAKGATTVYLKGGIGKDYTVGPGMIQLVGTDESRLVDIKSVREVLFSKVSPALIKRLAPNMTKEEFFASMRKRHPSFHRNGMVTVLEFSLIDRHE
ncbi:MAG: exonuclease domain-containing protein [Elusimicrobiota bacterium]